MKEYKLFFRIFLILFFAANLFADNNNEYTEQKMNDNISYLGLQKEFSHNYKITGIFADKKINHIEPIKDNKDNNVAYLGLQKEAPKSYKITGNFKKDNKYNKKLNAFNKYFVTGDEKTFESKKYNAYDINGIFSMNKSFNNKKTFHYNVTGMESKLLSSDKEEPRTYNIDGKEYYRKVSFAKYKKAQIDYLEMERKYKILALDKEMFSKKKLLDEELANDFSDVFLIEELSNDIKTLAVDKETVNINVDKKLKYILGSEQYLKYKQKQDNKNRNKK